MAKEATGQRLISPNILSFLLGNKIIIPFKLDAQTQQIFWNIA